MFWLNKTNVQQSIWYHYDSCNKNRDLCNMMLQVSKIEALQKDGSYFSMYSVGVQSYISLKHLEKYDTSLNPTE